MPISADQNKIAGYRSAMRSMTGRQDVDPLIERMPFTVEGAAASERLLDHGLTATWRART